MQIFEVVIISYDFCFLLLRKYWSFFPKGRIKQVWIDELLNIHTLHNHKQDCSVKTISKLAIICKLHETVHESLDAKYRIFLKCDINCVETWNVFLVHVDCVFMLIILNMIIDILSWFVYNFYQITINLFNIWLYLIIISRNLLEDAGTIKFFTRREKHELLLNLCTILSSLHDFSVPKKWCHFHSFYALNRLYRVTFFCFTLAVIYLRSLEEFLVNHIILLLVLFVINNMSEVCSIYLLPAVAYSVLAFY